MSKQVYSSELICFAQGLVEPKLLIWLSLFFKKYLQVG
jgi:hypothetical protein